MMVGFFFSADRIFKKNENLKNHQILLRIYQNLAKSLKELFTLIRFSFFFTVKKNRTQAEITTGPFLKLSGALESTTPIIPPTFDRIEF